uniref:Uncharacterized protein n=1 Tax=Gopherus agassizii TaxID=38772 RepID=A0A452I448_9SAUR
MLLRDVKTHTPSNIRFAGISGSVHSAMSMRELLPPTQLPLLVGCQQESSPIGRAAIYFIVSSYRFPVRSNKKPEMQSPISYDYSEEELMASIEREYCR